MALEIESLVVNLKAKAKRETLHGRQYLVAPMTLIVPGVLNGSKGPLLYPKEEVSKNPKIWNHCPITLNHPPESASEPKILNEYGMGMLLNSRFEKDALSADGWFDVDKAMKVDSRVVNKLVKGEPIELSTGLGVEVEAVTNQSENTYNGVKYDGIARNFRPDHLAVLPDSVGACSIKDGCGILVNQKGDPLVANEMSFNQIESEIYRALLSKFKQDEPRPYVLAVFPSGFFIYELMGELFQKTWSISGKKLVLGNDAVKVRKDVNFVPIKNRSKKMADAKLVTELITNCDCWTEEDRETLTNMTDEKIKSFIDKNKKFKESEAVANAAKAGFSDVEGTKFVLNKEGKLEKVSDGKSTKKEGEEAQNAFTKEALLNQLKSLSPEEWFDAAPPQVKEQAIEYDRVVNQEKESLIEALVKNLSEADRPAKREFWAKQSVETLREAVSAMPKDTHNSNGETYVNPYRRPNYSGQAVGVANVSDDKVTPPSQPLGLPEWDFDPAK